MKTVTIRQLALRRKPPHDQKVAKGACLGLGVEVERTPAGYLISEDDAERVLAVLDRDRGALSAAS